MKNWPWQFIILLVTVIFFSGSTWNDVRTVKSQLKSISDSTIMFREIQVDVLARVNANEKNIEDNEDDIKDIKASVMGLTGSVNQLIKTGLD